MIIVFKFCGKDAAQTRHIGQIYKDQLLVRQGGHRVLDRIAPQCENCGSSDFYNLYETSRVFKLLNIPLGKCDTTYYFSCPECHDGFKLNQDEFEKMAQLAHNNTRYMEGKITKTEFENNLQKLKS